MALAVQAVGGMDILRTAHRVAPMYRRGLAAVVFVAFALAGATPVAAASSDASVLPPEQHTSEKGRRLATTYQDALRDLSAKVYHCMPWVEVKRNGIGFYKPKHLDGDSRYLSVNLYIDQQPSPEFAAFSIEERASRMFSRYVGPMLKRMARPSGLLADSGLDGFTVILEWLKQTPASASARPVHETIAAFFERSIVAEYIGGRLPARELAARARILAWDGETALGSMRVRSWDDDFVATYKVSNYQVAHGVACP
ncbi:MAG TPA: hypothetical protein VLA62_08090 [Solirubrobacterales bacterium]|nr:hypothetical protein [Solirubrobacterales bacterium]